MVKKKIYNGLNILKIASTIIILLHHFQIVTGFKFENFYNFNGDKFYFGRVVELFFIISGFFAYSYIEFIKNGCITLFEFFKKKWIRFYPHITISIFGIVFINFVYYLVNGEALNKTLSAFKIIIACLGVQRWGLFEDPHINDPMWYVSVLMLCFIVLYICLVVAKYFNFDEKYLFILIIAFGIYIKKQKIDFLFLNTTVFRGYRAFFIGPLIYYLHKTKQNVYAVSFSLVLIVFSILQLVFDIGNSMQDNLCTFVLFPSLVFFFSSDIFTSEHSWKVISNLSACTFAIYVFHSPLNTLVFKVLKSEVSGFTFFRQIIIQIAFGVLYHFYIENRINGVIIDANKNAIGR